MDFQIPPQRQTNRREAVRRVGVDVENMPEEGFCHGFITRGSEISQVHQYETETTLAGEFKNVRIFITNKLNGGKVRTWSDTSLHGTLRVMHLDTISGLPIASIRMNSCDSIGLLRSVIFEYELPLNFKFDPEISSTFTAVQTHLMGGEYLGFLFTSQKDRILFSRALESLQLQLKVTAKQIEQLKEEAIQQMENDFQN
jgi:hypothetical protein